MLCYSCSLNVLKSRSVSGHSFTEVGIFRMKDIITLAVVETFLNLLKLLCIYTQTYL